MRRGNFGSQVIAVGVFGFIALLNPSMGGHAVGLKLNHGRVTFDSDQYDVVAKTANPDATREDARAIAPDAAGGSI
jgi:hypothetical protein